MVYLLADSGSTKTDWCLTQDGNPILQQQTQGINPVYQSEREIECCIQSELLPALNGKYPQALYFYGAGCTPALTGKMSHILRRVLCPEGTIEVCSDMVGAARSLLGGQEGIACILGTGSNSCLWDGKRMVQNVSPLGFILGDEGSGAYLGKRLVGDLLKGQTPPYLLDAFEAHYALTPADIIERVYRRPFPNRFLASLSPFIAAHLHEPCLRRLVLDSFRAFIIRNVWQYPRYQDYPVCFTGSVAWHYRELLAEAAHGAGIRLGRVTASPLEGLVEYHSPATTGLRR